MSKYTKEELLKFQEEINHFYRMRKLFLGLGFAAIGTGLTLGLILAAATYNRSGDVSAGSYVLALGISAGIVLFILRGALYNRRIKNRKVAIQEAKKEYEIKNMFKDQQ